jgi:hypothetical protein
LKLETPFRLIPKPGFDRAEPIQSFRGHHF